MIFVNRSDGLLKRVKDLRRLTAQEFSQILIEVKEVLHADPQKVLALLGVLLQLLSENLSLSVVLTGKQKRCSLESPG